MTARGRTQAGVALAGLAQAGAAQAGMAQASAARAGMAQAGAARGAVGPPRLMWRTWCQMKVAIGGCPAPAKAVCQPIFSAEWSPAWLQTRQLQTCRGKG